LEQSPVSQSGPLAQVQEFVMESMPVAAVAHSFHVDALSDPRFQSDPNFQMFSLIELNELHHQVAAFGSLLRLQMGDKTALQSLGRNLTGFLANRQLGLQAAQRLPANIRQDPRMMTVMQLTEMSNQQVAKYMPVITQIVQQSGAPATGPLLVDHR
jgi:hypothetical protein